MRKGMEMATLAIIIITVAVGLSMGKFVFDFLAGMKEKGAIERCHLSTGFISAVRQRVEQSVAARATVPLEAVGKIDCPVIKKDVSEPKDIANEIRDCWYKTGERNNRVGYVVGLIDDVEIDHCIVCAEITPATDIRTTAVASHILDKTIRDGPGKGKTYFEYLNTKWTEGRTCKEGQRNANCFFLDFSTRCQARPSSSEGCEIYGENSGFTLAEGKVHYVVSLSSGINKAKWFASIRGGTSPGEEVFTHVFVVPADKVQNIKCDEFHYQAE